MQKVNLTQVRYFGFIWSVIFFVIFFYSSDTMEPLFYAAVSFFLISALYPKLFVITKIFPTWIFIGTILGWINTRIILFALFFMVFTPVAIFRRIIGKDTLNQKLNPQADSYFIDREIQPTSMKYRF